jgi:phosphate uptake regulator
MIRKVSRVGPATLVVSLPAKWAKKYGIKKGDDIEVTNEGSKLTISNEKEEKRKRIEINIKNERKFLKRHLNMFYKKGYDEIKFTYSNETILGKIQKEIDFLIGYEIMEQGENYCVVKNVASPLEDHLDSLSKRLSLTILNMFKETINSLEKKDIISLKKVSSLEKITNKLSFFYIRILNKKINYSYENKTILFFICEQLEQIADNLRDISNEIEDLTNLSHNSLLMLNELKNLFEQYTLLYNNINLDKIEQFKNIRKKTYNNLKKKILKSKEIDSFVLSNLLCIYHIIHQLEINIISFVKF